jgi:hypothetical protein
MPSTIRLKHSRFEWNWTKDLLDSMYWGARCHVFETHTCSMRAAASLKHVSQLGAVDQLLRL